VSSKLYWGRSAGENLKKVKFFMGNGDKLSSGGKNSLLLGRK
jgi:hypothetical protein